MSSLTTAIGTGLLDPLKIGSLQLPNRIIMAPLTRCRASEGRVPNVLMAEYYRQRASAGLIISEARAVTPMGVGYPDTPGIWSDEQVEGWRLVTEAVHAEGGGSCYNCGTWGEFPTRPICTENCPLLLARLRQRATSTCFGPRRIMARLERWSWMKFRKSLNAAVLARRMPWTPASMASRSMAPTAIC